MQSESSSAAETASPTELLVMFSNGNVAPLSIFPLGMDTNGLIIFECSISDYQPEDSDSESLTSASTMDSSPASPTPQYAGHNQSIHRPHSPTPEPIKGTPGKVGVAWQGDHPDPGTSGISGFNPPANRTGNIQLSPNYLLQYRQIVNAGKIAAGVEKKMTDYKWTTAFNYGNDNITAALLRKPSKGGSNLFNYCNIGLLVGHGIRGANQDFKATATPSLQT